MKIDREQLIRELDAVSPGLAVKETVEQSSCFVFQGGEVMTFNDEIACRMETGLNVKGAVAAKPLLDLLNKLTETTLDISVDEAKGQLRVKGSRRRAGIAMEADITLPVDDIVVPDEWSALHPNFGDAASMVHQCASKDSHRFTLTCVHITPDHVEACDNAQLIRYDMETGFEANTLIKRDSTRHLTGLGIVEIAETQTWCHFRNPAGLVISVRREVGEDYPDLDPMLEADGAATTLPGGLAEAISIAEIFCSEQADGTVTVKLKDGKLLLRGEGNSGFYEEQKEIKWDADPIGFLIAPALLAEITTRTNDCLISEKALTIEGGEFTYVTSLEVPDVG